MRTKESYSRIKDAILKNLFIFPLILLVACGSNSDSSESIKEDINAWDKIAALSENQQPTVLPSNENLIAYESLRSFSEISNKLNPETPYLVGSSLFTPSSCDTAATYALFDGNHQTNSSILSSTLGGGWSQVFLDTEKGKTLSLSIFEDLGKSELPAIQLLKNEIDACPIVFQKINEVDWNYEFKSRQDSENTITIYTSSRSSEGLIANEVTSVNQVGRNLISSTLVHSRWNKGIPPKVSAEEEEDLVSSWVAIATKIIMKQG